MCYNTNGMGDRKEKMRVSVWIPVDEYSEARAVLAIERVTFSDFVREKTREKAAGKV